MNSHFGSARSVRLGRVRTPGLLVSDLRSQHRAEARLGYDGHNRRSGLTTMHRLVVRRRRRVWRRRLGGWLLA
jgi:hypothetical protein